MSTVTCTSCGAKNRLRTPPPGQVPVCGACKSPLPWIVEAGEGNFAAEVAGAPLVLVDFWAEWCGPCKMIAPFVEEIAQEYDGRVKVAKMDVDANPETPLRYGIRAIPTLLIFKGGKAVDQIVGAVPKAILRRRLEAALSS